MKLRLKENDFEEKHADIISLLKALKLENEFIVPYQNRTPFTKFQRSLRLLLSDFFQLLFPNSKKN